MLLTIFNEISDKRRGQGRMYELSNVILFTVFAILSGADSYRKVETYITENFKKLKKKFKLKWKKPPGYTTIRNIIQGVNSVELEKAFRKYSKAIACLNPDEYIFLGLDGKTARSSFDNFNDKKAVQTLSAFMSGTNIILAHQKVSKCKENEIEAAKIIFQELKMENKILFTLDALHCQKKLLKPQ